MTDLIEGIKHADALYKSCTALGDNVSIYKAKYDKRKRIIKDIRKKGPPLPQPHATAPC